MWIFVFYSADSKMIFEQTIAEHFIIGGETWILTF